ncbi:nucleoside/nucleotide kinase family protein [Mycoplasmopsis columbinasalis]|uniref:(d)CMP kinase n=1 Tax=Mycoplasmopsis columbinasalis TaxID=114880 RepID=A0A449B9I2_9BACT|nr:hypothetical protein [Mycoplasmopsis columbinasalis]VEU77827.1 Uncharacterised protein [Mycoplasmopsis columbinasalis]
MHTSDLKIVFLSGLSECGKSSVGMFLEEKLNFKRIKIIHVEKLLLKDFYKIDFSQYSKYELDDLLNEIYNKPNIYNLFLEKLLEIAEGKNISLESLHRGELFKGIKAIHPQTYCFYIEAEKQKRIAREYSKLSKIKQISYDDFLNLFEEKENLKFLHKVDKIKDIATHIIANSSTIEELFAQVTKIVKA